MIDDAAREFGEWLADRLPEDMLMPSKSVAVQDAVDALGAILRKRFQPAPGIERPDAPGVWFRDGEAYLVFADATNEIEMLFAANGLQMANGELCQEWVSDLPPGNWRRAVPEPLPPAPGA